MTPLKNIVSSIANVVTNKYLLIGSLVMFASCPTTVPENRYSKVHMLVAKRYVSDPDVMGKIYLKNIATGDSITFNMPEDEQFVNKGVYRRYSDKDATITIDDTVRINEDKTPMLIMTGQ